MRFIQLTSLAKNLLISGAIGLVAGSLAYGGSLFFVPRASAQYVSTRPLWDLGSRWQLTQEINTDIAKLSGLPISLFVGIPTWVFALLLMGRGLSKRETEILAAANRTTLDVPRLIKAAELAQEWNNQPIDVLESLGIKR